MRDAYRALRQTPVVSAVAILSLALGIGANTAIFSIVNALMLRALPVKEPQRLVQVLAGSNRTSWSNPLWEELRARDHDLFAGAFAYSASRFNLSWGGETRFVNGMFASGEVFDVLGVPAMLGRTFTQADDVRNGGKDGPVAVISYGFWLRHFGGAAEAIGKTLTLDRVAFTIIGVTTPSFTGVDHGSSYDVAIPLGTEPLIRGEHDSAMNELMVVAPRNGTVERGGHVLVNETFVKKYFGAQALGRTVRLEAMPDRVRPEMQIIGVVRDAVYDSLRDRIPPTIYLSNLQPLRPPVSATLSVRAASGSASLLARSVVDAMTHVDRDVSLTVRPYKSTIRVATVQERVLAMISGFFGALALLLAGLGLYGVMSYAVNRRRTEIGIRMALGAGPGGAVRLVLRRAAMLVAAGVVVGTGVTLWSAQFVASLLYGLQPRDPGTVAGSAALLAAIGLLAGWLPARRASRIDPAEVLRET